MGRFGRNEARISMGFVWGQVGVCPANVTRLWPAGSWYSWVWYLQGGAALWPVSAGPSKTHW